MIKLYDKYKESDDIWLGSIPQHWCISSLKHFVEIISGYAFKSEDYSDDEGVPIIRIGDISNSVDVYSAKKAKPKNLDELERFIIKRGDLLLAMTGATIGKNCMYATDAISYVNQRVGLLRGKRSLTQSFLKYYIDTPLFREFISLTCSGSAQENISASQVGNLQFPLPSLEEQTKIAQYLDYQTAIIDQLIQQKVKLIELLKEKRQAVINEAVTKGLNPNVKMKDSGIEWLGEIPETWKISKLKYISSIISKGTTPSTEGKGLADEGIRYLKSENIKDLEVSATPEFFIDEETHEILKRSQLQENDILFVIAGATIGKVAILPKELTPSNTNQAVSFIRLRKTENHKFIHYWLMSSLIYDQTWIKAVQSAQPNLSMENLGNFPLPYPSQKEQKEIVEFLNSKIGEYEDLIKCNVIVIDKLKEYRQSIISEAVTGKIDVREWQPNNQVLA